MKELERRNKDLEMENAILRKFNLFCALENDDIPTGEFSKQKLMDKEL